jgi:type I restriction enzyme S subunit
VLAKAFLGELVPQDPNDESASVLLERLKAEQAVAGEKTKSRKRPAAASS